MRPKVLARAHTLGVQDLRMAVRANGSADRDDRCWHFSWPREQAADRPKQSARLERSRSPMGGPASVTARTGATRSHSHEAVAQLPRSE